MAIQTPKFQKFVSDKILSSLSEKYDAEWSIDDIKIDFMDEVIINGIVFQDQNGDTLLAADRLKVDIGLFNLFNQEIRLDEVILDGAYSHIYDEDGIMNFDFLLPKSEAQPSANESSEPWDISLGQIIINDPVVDLDIDGQSIHLDMNNLAANFTRTNFTEKILDLSSLNISKLKVDYLASALPKESSEFVFPDLGWNINANQLGVDESEINYKTSSDTFNIANLNLTAKNININSETIELEISDTGLKFNEDIVLSKFQSVVKLQQDVLTLNDLILETDNDQLALESTNYDINKNAASGNGLTIDVDHQTLQKVKKYLPAKLNLASNSGLKVSTGSFTYRNEAINVNNLNAAYGNIIDARGDFMIDPSRDGSLFIDSKIQKVKIDMNKAGELWEGISIPDSLKQYKELTITGDVEGTMDSLQVNNATLQIDDVLDFKATGSLSNLSNPELLSFDVHIDRLSAEVAKLPIAQNENVALDSLGLVNFSGQLSGNMKDLNINGDLNSDLGSLSADLKLNIPDDIQNIAYNGELKLNDFDVGTLLKNDNLDKLSIRTKLDGKGLDFNNLNSNIDGVISDFSYNGYTYADINLNAEISDRTIDGSIAIKDKNASFSYDGIIKLDTSATILDFTASIDTLNMKALGFMSKQLSISGDVDSEIRLPLRSGEVGRVDITNLVLDNQVDSFREDSIRIKAEKSSDSTFVSMNADFADLDLRGQFGIRDIPASIGEMVDYYINLDTSFVHLENRSKSLAVNGIIRTLAPVNIVMPQLFLQSGIIRMNTQMDFVQHEIAGEITLDSFFVSSFFSEKLALQVDSESKIINANITGENNKVASSEIPIIIMNNTFAKNKIASIFEAKDSDQLPRLRFGINTNFEDGFTELKLSDSLILNKKDWLASSENSIKLYPDKVVVDDFSLTDNNEFLKVNSTDDEGNGLNIDFKNFNIGQFTTLITSQPSKLSGNIDGTIDLLDLNNDPYYLVNLKVEDMIYDSTSVGVLTIDADDNQATGVLTTDISLIGPSNDVRGGGTYNTKSTDLDFDLDIIAFQMMLLDPFLSEILKDSDGNITGEVRIDGTASKPLIDGRMTLDDVVTTIVVNNSRYGVEEQTIRFDNNAIDIGTIDIFDAKNNVATVSGKIYHSFLQDMELDLDLQTDEFTFLNTSASDNPVFFGKMVLEADVELTGPIDLLDVQVVAKTLDSTEVNISPFSIEKFLLEEDFITYGKPSDFEDLTNEYLLKLARQFPFKVNIILDATQTAKMNFVVDPITGDKIVGQGNGNLRIKLNPDGQQEIFGTYTISDGAYTFSYGDFVSKDFKVKPGGTVKFNGNPLNAVLDIDAIYRVYTTTYELIKNEIYSNASEVSAAQRRTNVDVYLSLKGTLDNPEIALDIQVPDLESANLVSTIDLKLNELRANPNELNNQVFGLLIFNSFILSDNVASGFGSLGNNIALSSVSSLISNQLNKLADKVVKGVDVDINVNSYDSQYINEGAGGTVTEVGLKVSKQLFNDRLSISAGGNFDLSDQTGAEPYSSLIGDFVLEYKLTESGRYRVRVFSKADYDRLLNENTNKNGVSLFFNRSFDSKLDD